MRFMKKWMSVLLALILFVGSIGILPMKAEAASNSYVTTSLTKSGETVTLQVNMSNYRYLTNGKFVINYDKNVLSLRSATKGTGTYTSFDVAEVNTGTDGQVVYGFASAAASYKYGTLLTVAFDVKNVTEQSTTVTTQVAELVNAGTHYTAGETTLSDSVTVGKAAPVTNYTVSFYSNGSLYTTQTVASGSYATEPTAPTRTGYTFTGWYTNSAATNKFNFSTPITANTTLYAGWQQNSTPVTTYTVSFYSEGSLYTTQTVASGGYATEPTPPTRAGYKFKGWYITSVERYQTDYYKWEFDTDRITGDRRLYAGWEVASTPVTNYTVRFYSNGSLYTTQTVASGRYATEPTAPTRTGYTFTGWYTDSTATYYKYSFSTPVTANLTLYAGWKQDSSSSFAAPTITNISKYYSYWYSRVLVTWSSVSGAYGYELYRSTSQYGTYSYITTTSYSYAYDSTATSGTTYYYRVRAYKYSGYTKIYSDFSAPYTFRP